MKWLEFLFRKPKAPPPRAPAAPSAPDAPAPGPREPREPAREESWSRQLAAWPFPLKVIAGAAAEEAWRAEAAVAAREGFSPLLVTPRTPAVAADRQALLDAPPLSPDEILRHYVARLTYEDWAVRRPTEVPARFEAASPELVATALAQSRTYVADDPYAYVAPDFAQVTELPAEADAPPLRFESLSVPFVWDTRFPEVAISRMPTAESWRLPLYLGFGGFDGVPAPLEIAAFAQRWQRQYGAEVASINADTLEFVVARPPEGFEAARRLAMEHALFCPEDLDDRNEYIAALRSARSWFFWWD